MLPVEGLEPDDVFLVDEHVVGPHDPGAELVPGPSGARVVRRGHLGQVRRCLCADLRQGRVVLHGIPLERGDQSRVLEQGVDVAAADDRAGGCAGASGDGPEEPAGGVAELL